MTQLTTVSNAAPARPLALAAETVVKSTGAVYGLARDQKPTLPLAVLPDMASEWHEVDLSFDDGAALLLKADEEDGSNEAEEIPVSSFESWTPVPVTGGLLGLCPKTGYRGPLPMRREALGDLLSHYKAGAGVNGLLRDRMPAMVQIGALAALMREAGDTGGMLRVRRGEITSIVSQRYAPFGAARMVEAAREALVRANMLGEVRVRGWFAGMSHGLRLSIPGRMVEVKKNDVTEVQIDLRNSDFGDAAFSLRAGLYRLVCKNGLRAYEQTGRVAFNHSGKMNRLENAVKDGFDRTIAASTGLLARWQASADVWMADMMTEIEAMQDFDMTEAERAAVATSVEASTGLKALPGRQVPITAYDLINGLTDAAKAASPDRRQELETIAGELLVKRVAA